MAEKRDYYEVLELDKNATEDQIKSQYRKLAKKYHPDLNKEPGAEAKFKEVQEAYEVLSDPQKKAAYDQYGHAAFDQNGGQSGFGGFQGGFQDVDLNDIFGSFFGGGARRKQQSGPTRGNDRFMTVRINFMDAIKGKKIELNITLDENCPTCNGSGAASPSDIVSCNTCNGTGYVSKRVQSIFGMIQETQSVCPTCSGKGKTIKNKCSACQGKGYNRVKRKIEVNIPAGINNGQQIRVTGKGERGSNGGPNGDLYIEIVVDTDSAFRRDGNDIHVDLEVSMIDAALGCTMSVGTVYGEVEVKIPEGSQSGQTLKLREKGVKDIRGNSFGDEYIHLKVVTPTKLNDEQKELLRKFKEVEDTKSNKTSIFDKLKKKKK
jgi:molecular chaperone DnaJ